MTRAAIQHIHQVSAVVEGHAKPPADEAVWKSWLRSATELKVDPASSELPRILTAGELQNHRETAERFIELAQAELIKRGEYLAHAADCITCHTAPGVQAYACGHDLNLTVLGTMY